MSVIAAWTFTGCIAVLMLFQLALAGGAPWGHLAMAGRFPGRLPPAMRVAAIVQIAIYGLLAGVILARAGLALPEWLDASRWAAWVVVAVSAVAAVLNLITPSKWERILWAPVAAVMLATSVVVALSGEGGAS